MLSENFWTVFTSLKGIMDNRGGLADIFPSGVYPIKIGLRLDLSPSGEPVKIDDGEEKKSPKLFQPPRCPFKVTKDNTVWIPGKVIGIENIIEKPYTSQDYKDRDNPHRNNAIEDENIWAWKKIEKHVKNAINVVEREGNSEMAERFYIDKLRICEIPQEYTPWEDLTNEEKRDFYEGENKCGIAEFTKANERDKRLLITKEAKTRDGSVKAFAPGESLIPLTLNMVKRVYTKPIHGARAQIKRAYYTNNQAEKHNKPDAKPMEWSRREDTSSEALNDWFEKVFPHLCGLASDNRCPIIKKFEIKYNRSQREDELVQSAEELS